MSEPLTDAAQADALQEKLSDSFETVLEYVCHHRSPAEIAEFMAGQVVRLLTELGHVEALRAALAAGPPSREQVRQAIVSAKAYEQVEAATDAVMALLARPSDPPPYRALLDEILDWLACSKWAVDNQKATEWELRIREIERQR